MADLRLMPSRMLALCGGVAIDAVLDHEHVLAGALADVALVVEQDRLLVAGLDRLDLGQHGVEVLPAGLGVRDQRVRRDAAPGGDLRPHAVLLALVAEVGAPLPDGDHRLDVVLQRVEAHRPRAAEDQRADVAALEAVAADQLMGGLAQLLLRVREVHVVEPGRALEPVQMVVVAEDRGAALGLVGADALEHAGAVVEGVREHVHLGVLPGDEFAVHPDDFGVGHRASLRGSERPQMADIKRKMRFFARLVLPVAVIVTVLSYARLPGGAPARGPARDERRRQSRSRTRTTAAPSSTSATSAPATPAAARSRSPTPAAPPATSSSPRPTSSTLRARSGGQLSGAVQLAVLDQTNGNAVVYSGPLSGLGERALVRLGPGQSRSYYFAMTLPDGGARRQRLPRLRPDDALPLGPR